MYALNDVIKLIARRNDANSQTASMLPGPICDRPMTLSIIRSCYHFRGCLCSIIFLYALADVIKLFAGRNDANSQTASTFSGPIFECPSCQLFAHALISEAVFALLFSYML